MKRSGKERAIRWNAEVWDGPGMDFNARLNLEEEAEVRRLKEEAEVRRLREQQDSENARTDKNSSGAMVIDRLTGRPIGQKE